MELIIIAIVIVAVIIGLRATSSEAAVAEYIRLSKKNEENNVFNHSIELKPIIKNIVDDFKKQASTGRLQLNVKLQDGKLYGVQTNEFTQTALNKLLGRKGIWAEKLSSHEVVFVLNNDAY